MRSTLACLAALFCLTAITVPAAQISFMTLPSNIERGTYNGYVQAEVDGELFDLICDDYLDTTYVPSGPFLFHADTIDDLETAMFGPARGVAVETATINYQAAALLLDGLGHEPAKVAAFQYALWRLFTPSTPVYQDSAALLADALARASAPPEGHAAIYDRLVIYTPADSHNQEFLRLADRPPMQIGPSAVPEPETLLLGGIGIVLLMSKRFLRR
jgi:hypothetical protein